MKSFLRKIAFILIITLTILAYWIAGRAILKNYENQKVEELQLEKSEAALKLMEVSDYINANGSSFENIGIDSQLTYKFKGVFNNYVKSLFKYYDYKDIEASRISERSRYLTIELLKRIGSWPDSIKQDINDNVKWIFFVDGMLSDGAIEYIGVNQTIILLRGDAQNLSYSKYEKSKILRPVKEAQRSEIDITIETNIPDDELSRLERTLLHELGHAIGLSRDESPKWNHYRWDIENYGKYRGVFKISRIDFKPNNDISKFYNKMGPYSNDGMDVSEYVQALADLPLYTISFYEWNNELEFVAEKNYCKYSKLFTRPESTVVTIKQPLATFILNKCVDYKITGI